MILRKWWSFLPFNCISSVICINCSSNSIISFNSIQFQCKSRCSFNTISIPISISISISNSISVSISISIPFSISIQSQFQFNSIQFNSNFNSIENQFETQSNSKCQISNFIFQFKSQFHSCLIIQSIFNFKAYSTSTHIQFKSQFHSCLIIQNSNVQFQIANLKLQAPSLKHPTSNLELQFSSCKFTLPNCQILRSSVSQNSNPQIDRLSNCQIPIFPETWINYEIDSDWLKCREPDINRI